MSTRLALPPTPLGSGLLSTLGLYTLSLLGDVEAAVTKAAYGGITINVEAGPADVERCVLRSLKRLSDAVEKLRGKLPLVARPGPGTDRDTLTSRRKLGLSIPGFRAEQRRDLYTTIVQSLEREKGKIIDSLSRVEVEIEPRKRIYKICLGGCEGSVPVPVIVKSEAFYEIGRFGGLSDRKKSGQPDAGRVDYRGLPPYTLLLYATLLVFQVGCEGDTHMFLTVDLEPGSRLTGARANTALACYEDAVSMLRSIGVRVWLQDYEGLRLASSFWLLPRAPYLPRGIGFSFHVIAETGRRFYGKWHTTLSLDELDAYAKTLETLVEEMGAGNVEKLSKLVTVLITATLRMLSTRGAQQESLSRLWAGVRSLAYSLLEARRYVMIDQLYQLLRLFSDYRTGLRSELLNSMTSVAESLGLSLESLVWEKADTIAASIWKTLRKLTLFLTS